MKYKARIQAVKKALEVVWSGGFQGVSWFKGNKDRGQKLQTMHTRAVTPQTPGEETVKEDGIRREMFSVIEMLLSCL